MIKKLELKNFTVFPKASFNFGSKLNIAIGANGSGKTHILKLLYTFTAFGSQKEDALISASEQLRTPQENQTANFEKLLEKVFNSTSESLVAHASKDGSMDLTFFYEENAQENNLDFRVENTNAHQWNIKTSKIVASLKEKIPDTLKLVSLCRFDGGNALPIPETPLFLPTHELLSLYPHFSSLAKKYKLSYDQTYEDTIFALGMPPLKDDSFFYDSMKKLYQIIEETLGGKIYLGNGGNYFYLKLKNDDTPMEINLVAEGWRKLGMIMVLLKNGSLLPGMTLLWDEPEANLNPALIRITASIITFLAQSGIQVFITTHSLFFLKELDMLTKEKGKFKSDDVRYFNFIKPGKVEQGNTPEDLTDILMLDESLRQSDRYLQMED